MRGGTNTGTRRKGQNMENILLRRLRWIKKGRKDQTNINGKEVEYQVGAPTAFPLNRKNLESQDKSVNTAPARTAISATEVSALPRIAEKKQDRLKQRKRESR